MAMNFVSASAQSVTIGVQQLIPGSNQVTIAAWMTTVGAQPAFTRALQYENGPLVTMVSIRTNFGQWEVSARPRSADPEFSVQSGVAVSTSLTHVVGVIDFIAGTIRVFTNGVLTNSGATATWYGGAGVDNGPAYLAARATATQTLNGELHGARSYQRALSDDEVMGLFLARGRDRDAPFNRWTVNELSPGTVSVAVADKMGLGPGTPDNSPVYAENNITVRARRGRR